MFATMSLIIDFFNINCSLILKLTNVAKEFKNKILPKNIETWLEPKNKQTNL